MLSVGEIGQSERVCGECANRGMYKKHCKRCRDRVIFIVWFCKLSDCVEVVAASKDELDRAVKSHNKVKGMVSFAP